MMKLTANEATILKAMIRNADHVAGGDFGIMDEVERCGLSGQAFGGVVTNLQDKKLVTLHGAEKINGVGKPLTQFTVDFCAAAFVLAQV